MPLRPSLVYVVDRRLRTPPATFKYSAIAAIVLLGVTTFLLRSVAGGQASVLVTIAQMGFFRLGSARYFLLRERITVRKTLGLGLALGALAVLAGG